MYAVARKPRESVPRLVAAADARIALARHPVAGAQTIAAMILLFDALELLDRAHEAPPSLDGELESLRRARDRLAIDRLGGDERARLLARLDEHVERLRLSLDVRPPRERWGDRARAALAFAVVCAAALFLGIRLFAPKNVAIGKTVTTSTSPGGGPNFEGLVDGELHDGVALLTGQEPRAWIKVDLGAVHALSSVGVFNRRDCCWSDDLPWVLELSEDGAAWTAVSTKYAPFYPNDPWQVSLRGRRARFVRVRTTVAGTRVALSSLQVFGRVVK